MKREVQKASLLFLLTDTEIVLAMKKRGFGKGYWNGVGGKKEADETMVQCAIRECEEEIGVKPRNLTKVAVLRFFWNDKPDFEFQVDVFTSREWEGDFQETEEMLPQWFNRKEIPHDLMWDDDKYWLPHVLKGMKIRGSFWFGSENKITKFTVSGT
jgi:8-oxo-dGTP diphosphatase